MTDKLTAKELKTRLGISGATILRLRNRAHDPLPAPIGTYYNNHGHLYDRATIAKWLKNNPAYEKAYQHRKGKKAERCEVFDTGLANAFLTGRL